MSLTSIQTEKGRQKHKLLVEETAEFSWITWRVTLGNISRQQKEKRLMTVRRRSQDVTLTRQQTEMTRGLQSLTFTLNSPGEWTCDQSWNCGAHACVPVTSILNRARLKLKQKSASVEQSQQLRLQGFGGHLSYTERGHSGYRTAPSQMGVFWFTLLHRIRTQNIDVEMNNFIPAEIPQMLATPAANRSWSIRRSSLDSKSASCL